MSYELPGTSRMYCEIAIVRKWQRNWRAVGRFCLERTTENRLSKQFWSNLEQKTSEYPFSSISILAKRSTAVVLMTNANCHGFQ